MDAQTFYAHAYSMRQPAAATQRARPDLPYPEVLALFNAYRVTRQLRYEPHEIFQMVLPTKDLVKEEDIIEAAFYCRIPPKVIQTAINGSYNGIARKYNALRVINAPQLSISELVDYAASHI